MIDETSPDEVEQHRMPLMEHLRELRKRLLWSAGALFVGMIISMALVEPIYAFLTAPMRLLLVDGQRYPEVDAFYLWLTSPMRNLLPASLLDAQVAGTMAITTSPMEGMTTWFRVAVVAGALIASPVIAFQVWAFVAPGLYAKEKRLILPLAASSSFLFISGVAFAFLVLLPVAFPFFLQVLKAEAILSVDGYLSSIVRMLIAFGLCFQLPIAVWFVARMGLIDARDMFHGFRYAMVGIFAISAILTPPDVLTQFLLAVPMTALYVVSIVVAWFASTKVRTPPEEAV